MIYLDQPYLYAKGENALHRPFHLDGVLVSYERE